MKRFLLIATLLTVLLTACAPVDLNAAIPVYKTGVDSEAWAQVPAGEFYSGQHDEVKSTEAYEIMVTNVTTAQYIAFLNAVLAEGVVKIEDLRVSGYYSGDEFRGYKHEERIEPGDYIYIPLDDPSQRVKYDGTVFSAQPGYENHPMTMVSWFGARLLRIQRRSPAH
jgi:formylglycine-generating enzyme required for sulfatase activity